MRLKRITGCVMAAALSCLALTGCGSSIDAKAVGATLNGEEISLGFMNFMAKYQQASYDPTYVMYFGTDYWKQEMGDGKTMEQTTKEGVAEGIQTLYLLEDHMADYDVSVSEEEIQAMEEAAKQFMSDNSEKAIKQMGATEEYVKEMLRLYTIQYKMRTAIYDEADVTVTDEEAAQRTFSYFRTSAKGTTDEEGNEQEFTDEEKAEVETKMKAAAEAAKTDFEGAAKEQGYTVSAYSYGADEESMDEAVIKAADALKEGEVSELITTDDYYYVIRLDSEYDEEKTASKKVSLESEKRTDHYTEVCDGYREASTYEINESNWAKVKFDRLFGAPSQETDQTGLQTEIEEIEEEDEDQGEESQGEESDQEEGEESEE